MASQQTQNDVPRQHRDPEKPTQTEIPPGLKHHLKYLGNYHTCSMKRAVSGGIKVLKTDTVSTQSRVDKIFSEAAAAGTRAVPAKTQSNDAKMRLRLDFGEVFDRDGVKYRQFNLQPNKQAENATIRKLAEQDSHQNLASIEVQIDPKPKDRKAVVAGLFDELAKKVNAK